jgi:glucans biosynthesis protein C
MMATSNAITTSRRHDLDNLRTFLTKLVIMHHTAIPYGGVGAWNFISGAFDASSPLLSAFNAVNQTFFMGLFFWISGRVSAQSLARSEPLSFIKSKCIRLGIPAVVYALIIEPMVRAMVLPRWDSVTIRDGLLRYWFNMSGVQGPLWYTATLLTFDVATAVASATFLSSTLRRQTWRPPDGFSRVFHALSVWGGIPVSLCSFLARCYFPSPTAVPIISLQIGYAAQYIYAYLLGHLSYLADEERMIGPLDIVTMTHQASDEFNNNKVVSKFESRISFRTAVILSAVSLSLVSLPSCFISGNRFNTMMQQLSGGLNWTSFIYTTWNEVSFVVIGPTLMDYFVRYDNEPTQSQVFIACNSYAAFLLHPLICIIIEWVAERLLFATYNGGSNSLWASSVWHLIGPVIVTIGVGLPSVWVSFFTGGELLKWVPSLRRVI